VAAAGGRGQAMKYPPPVSDRPQLTLIVPVYDERSTVLEVIERLHALPFSKQIVVVDDGSTDGTTESLATLDHPDVEVVHHDRNRGKGAALRTGFALARGQIVAVQDADLEYDPVDLPALMQPILDGKADVVYGSRLSGGRPQRVFLFWHLGRQPPAEPAHERAVQHHALDMETGYKVMRREVLEGIRLRSDDFTVEPELTAKILKGRWRVYELPIAYYGRSYDEGKKITWRHGVTAVVALFRYRFSD
jgi:glycosyltransferase involved in cell wall biosynthesis